MNKDKSLFIRFLKEHNVYYQFISYCDKHSFEKISIIDYLNRPFNALLLNGDNCKEIYFEMINDYLTDSFSWYEYNMQYESKILWSGLNDKWMDICDIIHN